MCYTTMMTNGKDLIVTSIVVTKAIIINNENQILLIKRSNENTTDVGQWEVPGGKLEKGQLIEDSLKRELEEEVNIKLENFESNLASVSSRIITNNPDYRGITVVTITQLVKLNNIPKITLSHEHDEYKWVSKEQALKMDLREATRLALETPDFV